MSTPVRSGVFVMEQTLGHHTYSQNLEHALSSLILDFSYRWLPIAPASHRGLKRLLHKNWTVSSALTVRRQLSQLQGESPIDFLFFHTQTVAMLAHRWSATIPSIVSIDATPKQIDHYGKDYDHKKNTAIVERFKYNIHRRCFQQAKHLIAWSHWAKSSLVKDYGIDPSKISVISPGVDTDWWAKPADPTLINQHTDNTCRILFVGNDFKRKGGEKLLNAVRMLNARHATEPKALNFELTLVSNTNERLQEQTAVTVYRDVHPNSVTLRNLYHSADLFVLPTSADCLAMVLIEACAAGLPIVSTNIGGITDVVRNNHNGTILCDDSTHTLVEAIQRIASKPDIRHSMSKASLTLAGKHHDSSKNAQQLVEIINRSCSDTINSH